MKRKIFTTRALLMFVFCITQLSVGLAAQTSVNKDQVSKNVSKVSSDNSSTGTSEATNVINKSVSFLSGFTYNVGSGPSAQQSFTVSGSGLDAEIVVTAPDNYEISVLGGTAFNGTSSLTIGRVNGAVSPVTIYVRLKSGLHVGAYSDQIVLSSTGSTSQSIYLSGFVSLPAPSVAVSQTSLSGFSYTYGYGPSAVKSFTVSGSDLTGDVVVKAPTNYEISLTTGGTFQPVSLIQLSPKNGALSKTTIYVRLKAGLDEANYTGNISVTTTDASASIALSGSVSPNAVITTSETSISSLDYVVDKGPSAIKSVLVHATGVSSFLIVSAEGDFEISTEGGDYFEGSTQLLFIPLNGVVDSATVYVRMVQDLPKGSYSGNLSITTGDSDPVTVSLAGKVTTSTAVNAVSTSGELVFVEGGNLVVDRVGSGQLVSVYKASGQLVKSFVSTGGRESVSLGSGVYIVKCGGNIRKVIL